MTGAKATVTITHPTGLHARPAVRLTRLAKTFPATIRVRPLPNGTWIDAKSIVKVMALKLRTGTEIEIEAEGEGAEAAVASLNGLVTRNFDEDG
jgi:phosphocarrier protein HPr